MYPLAIIDLLWAAAMWALPTVALSVGMYYLSQAIFGQDLKEAEAPEDSRGRLWNPHTTQAEGLSRPRNYGMNMHHGNVIGKWTDVDGTDREILYLLIDHGDGPTKGNVAGKVWLNDQPAANFGSVVIQERPGTMDQTCMAGFEKSKLEYVLNNTELKEVDPPFVWTSPNKFFDDIEFTIAFLNGLIRYRKSGSSRTKSVEFKIRIREHPSGSWVTIFNSSITAGTAKPFFKKYSVSDLGFTCKRGTQYDLDFERLTPVGGARTVAKSYLRSVREVVEVPFTHPGKALTGIKAIATAQLSGNIDVKIIREDRLVNTFNGSTWEIKYSRNRADVAFDIATQPVISGNGDSLPWEIERYEGTNPANIDIEFFYNWASFCGDQVLDGFGGTEDRLACDLMVDYETDIWTLLHDIAEIGRAKLWWEGTVLTGWIDKIVSASEITDLVTMDTLMARTWKNHWVGKSELAGVVNVFFNDSRQGYERVPLPYPKASAGSYKRTISIEGIGITTYGTAVHVANHALERNHLINNVNNFRQQKDGFLHKLGKVIRLQHMVPNWGQGYRVVSCTSNVITLDRRVVGVNANDLLYVRCYDEVNKKVVTEIYTVVSSVRKQVTIAETFSPVPPGKSNVAIGAPGKIVLRRITKIEPDVTNYFDVTVETYDPVLYDADLLDPDAPSKDYIWSAPPGVLAKPVSHDEVVDIFDNVIPPQPAIDVPQRSNCAWTGDSVDTVTWAKDDATEEIVLRFEGVDYLITPDNTTDEFIYWDPNFSTQFKTTNLVTVATAAGRWLMCRNIDGVAYPVPCTLAANIGIILAGFLRVGTADIENLAVTTAKINNLAVETLKIANEAVTVPSSSYTDGGVTIPVAGVELATVDVDTLGGTVLVICNVFLATSDTTSIVLEVKRDANIINTSGAILVFVTYTQGYSTIVIEDTPGSGSFTYSFRGKRVAGNQNGTGSKRSIFILEAKK